MGNEKYIIFLKNIIEDTKNRKMEWDYLDANASLYEGMNWTRTKTEFSALSTKEKEYPNFDRENSFYTSIGSTYIVLLVRSNQPAVLYVVPNTYKKIVKLSPDEYGELITRLLNLVESQFPNAEDFIEEYIGKN